jgi:co-chaperonin GroES (HSP10)
MAYKVIHTNILVQEVPQEENSIIVEGENLIWAIVKEIGNGIFLDGKLTPMQVRPQSKILFSKSQAVKIPNEEDLYVLNQKDIILIDED